MSKKRLTPGLHGRYGTRRKAPAARRRGRLDSDTLFDLLRRRTAKNAGRIDREIEARSMEDMTMLMCDSSGFSRKTHEFGILQFLAVMTRCYDRLIPMIEKGGGECLSHSADNIVGVFKEPADAIKAAVAMHLWLRRYNRDKAEAERFNICIGIHCGTVVRLNDNVFGDKVNVAAKIGEDLAAKDEILVSRDVVDRVLGRFVYEYSRAAEIGGRPFELYRVRY